MHDWWYPSRHNLWRYCGRCGLTHWRHLRWFAGWAFWSGKRTWL